MNKTTQGIIAAMLAAFIFGFTPVIGKLSYDGGSNAVMLTLLRGLMAVPVLYAIAKVSHIPLDLTRKNKVDILIICIFGYASTALTLYASYDYISVGVATLIHFTYPSFVALYSLFFLKEKISKETALSLVFSTAGLAFFTDDISGSGPLFGFILALISAVTFAFVMIYQYRSSLISFHPFKISFYQCIVTSMLMLLFGFATDNLTVSLTTQAWIYSFIVALFVSVIAFSLVQYALQYIGSTSASILQLIEPITSVIMGIIVLGEDFTIPKFIGCALIIFAVVLFTMGKKKQAQVA